MFVYELTDCGFGSTCSHLNFRFYACFEQGVPWHSSNYRVWIHSETRAWHDNNIQSGIPSHNSESPGTAGRKTTRTQATEKYYAFHVNTTRSRLQLRRSRSKSTNLLREIQNHKTTDWKIMWPFRDSSYCDNEISFLFIWTLLCINTCLNGHVTLWLGAPKTRSPRC